MQQCGDTLIAASVILVTIVCAILGFRTLHGVENKSIGNNYADNYFSPQARKHMKQTALRDVLRNYDKKNIAETYVFLSDLDGEVTKSHIIIIYRVKIPDFEMQSEIKSKVTTILLPSCKHLKNMLPI